MPYPYLTEDANVTATVSKKPKVIVHQFGEGYKQVQKDGINNNLETISLQFVRIDKPYIDSIVSFLDSRAGLPFYFTLLSSDKALYRDPADTGSSLPLPKLYYCIDYEREHGNGMHILKCKFEELVGGS